MLAGEECGVADEECGVGGGEHGEGVGGLVEEERLVVVKVLEEDVGVGVGAATGGVGCDGADAIDCVSGG